MKDFLTFEETVEVLHNVTSFQKARKFSIESLAKEANLITLSQGQTLLRSGVMESHAFLLLDGGLRLLAKDPFTDDLFTVGRVAPKTLVGFVNLLRQAPCEAAIARQPSKLLSFPINTLLALYQDDKGLQEGLSELKSPCEGAEVLGEVLKNINPPPADHQRWLIENIQRTSGSSSKAILSSVVEGYENLIGKTLTQSQIITIENKSKLPLRFWEWIPESTQKVESRLPSDSSEHSDESSETNELYNAPKNWIPGSPIELSELGLREATQKSDLQGFNVISGKGPVGTNIAILRMLARAYNTPCPIDVLERTIEAAVERTGKIPIQGIGQLAEAMGLQTQLGEVKFEQLYRLELPVVVNQGASYALLLEVKSNHITLADPEKGRIDLPFDNAKKLWGKKVQVLVIKRLSDTPKRTFGWDWFTPVLSRFRWSLVQVLLASLFIQLFQLANPLLLQQIIDKVISQSNLSALQVLGGALVAAALFQGLLTAVRTWLLIDTTDRMDLILGSQVIDKLLRLRLSFFEKRPVGELSQRLSELGNLRSFLTGTAITSALDLLFATIYIVIMLVYSPILTAVALSTVPLYVMLILFIAPLYRKLIRKQAQFAARTQSHLIETLGGIQTVKAQNFELNSRWRWQERYTGQIGESFKSVVLGTSASEVGNFLNQLSSLLIIWVGVYQVVKGELSLGQLIAFRIIAGYVTGPILRLSGLWQGFQQVGISMERLADIVDQVPESGEKEADQIAIPPIRGEVCFDKLKFRFGKNGPYQIDNVSIKISPGSFVGIVGQSGSGKSTLMKLLPRLYDPEAGRILIDGYDISKVSLSSIRQQIGIVPQDCLLFEGTIRENITMNLPEADTEDVIRVARAAAAHEFIMELPDGYGTQLGERGAGLSGGQRQRIAIARTLLQNPNLLVLDEATSALDYDTESTVCSNLQGQLNNKTVFFITHRLSTVRNADLIILMHQGKVAEQGTHQELLDLGGRYAALYAHQGDS